MTIVWGIVGMLVGVVIAAQLAWPALNFDIPWLTYGRLRPLHTNAVIFAFGGCALFATSYYVVQRTCHVRLFCRHLAAFTFWGWQAVIVLAAVTLPLGITQGKEYAELEWPIDILIAVVWVAYAVVFVGTIAKRRVRHIYVANWFFAAFILAVAMLHIVNSAVIPVSLWKSYSLYAGVQDAMVQWWYGHNAVGFFLTAGFLGIMYYFVPKQASRPIYSYRLSVVHFWSLVFTYMWAGPHHLHYTALRIGRTTRQSTLLWEYRCGRCRVRCRCGSRHIAVVVTRFGAGNHDRMSGRRWRPRGTGGEAQRGCGARAGAVRTATVMRRPGVALPGHGAAVRGDSRCSRCCGRRDG